MARKDFKLHDRVKVYDFYCLMSWEKTIVAVLPTKSLEPLATLDHHPLPAYVQIESFVNVPSKFIVATMIKLTNSRRSSHQGHFQEWMTQNDTLNQLELPGWSKVDALCLAIWSFLKWTKTSRTLPLVLWVLDLLKY